MRRALRILGLAITAGMAALAVGFAWFVVQASRPTPTPPHADGIVALTGGADRVETALRLLAAGDARKLLVSGIGGHAELGTLAHRAGVDPGPIADRVTLGRDATTTRGNATETAAWARENAIHSLIVVTAAYHMPRALTEIERAAPDLALYPMPVTPHALAAPDAAGRAMHVRLMAEEYVKFIAASLDLTALLPALRSQEPEPAAHDDPAHDAGARIGEPNGAARAIDGAANGAGNAASNKAGNG